KGYWPVPPRLFSDSDPGDKVVELVLGFRFLGDLEHADAVINGDVPSSETRNDVGHRRPVLQRVKGRAHFVHEYSAVIRRAVSEIAIDHTHRFEALERLAQFDCR